MAAADYSRNDDVALDLGQIVRAIWRAKTWLVPFVLVVAGLVVLALNLVTARYRADAKILIESRELLAGPNSPRGQEAERALLDQEGVASQVQLFTSRDLARVVLRKLDLAARPEYRGEGGFVRTLLELVGFGAPLPEADEQRALERFTEDVYVYQQEKSRVIVVEATATDPDLAARIANTLAEEYLSLLAATKRSETSEQSRWLEGEIENLRTRVAEAEAKVEAHRSGAELFIGPNNATLTAQQLGELNTQLTAARAQKSDAEAKAHQLRGLINSGRGLDSTTEVLASPVFQRLKDRRAAIQARIAELSTTLLPNHPQMRALNAQLADIDVQLRAEARKILSAVENDVKVADARVSEISAQLDRIKKQSTRANEQNIQLQALEREARTQRELLESFLARYREAVSRQNADMMPADARIISRAMPPIRPSFPKIVPSTVVAALAAFLLAVTFVVLRELTSGRALGPAGYAFARPVPDAVPLPPLAGADTKATPAPIAGSDPPPTALPAEPKQEDAPEAPLPAALVAFEGSVAALAEAIAMAGDAVERVAVTGIGPGSTTSAVALQLARLLARRGAKTILVDLDLSQAVESGSGHAGLAELMAGRASFGDVIVRDESAPRLHRVPAGASPVEPGRIDTVRIAELLKALEQAYDVTVASLGPLSDAEHAAAIAVGADLVVLASNLPPGDAGTAPAREALAGSGIRAVAVVSAPSVSSGLAERGPRLVQSV